MIAGAISTFWFILPILAGIWSIFVAKTGRLIPLAGRKQKALSAAKKDKAVADAQTTSDGPGTELDLFKEPEPEPVYETFGHPAPPIPVLKVAVPQPPIGYGWEIYTLANEAGNPALRLQMLDLKTTTVIDAIEADLVIARRWKYAKDDTYAMLYRKAEEVSAKKITGLKNEGYDSWGSVQPVYNTDHTKILGKVMMANLITPMVDWARLITLRYIVDNPDETKCNYVLVEARPKEAVPA